MFPRLVKSFVVLVPSKIFWTNGKMEELWGNTQYD